MHRAAKTSRFLIDLSSERDFADSDSSASSVNFLQGIVASHLANAARSRQSLSELAQSLIRVAEHAFSLRDMNALLDVGVVLMNLPIISARQIGHFYQALAVSRRGETDVALRLLKATADYAPLTYRARAIQTLGSIYQRLGHLDDSAQLYSEALHLASPTNAGDLLTTLMVHLNTSAIESQCGDHERALANLERLSPLVRTVSMQQPLYFYFYRNALAVELNELGRLAEAEAACAIALASPFAPAYPEWSETRDEIAARRVSASRSVVAFSRAREAAPLPQAEPQPRRNPVIKLAVGWPVCKTTFQRAIKRIAVESAVSSNEITQTILDRMLIRTGPRAPPALP